MEEDGELTKFDDEGYNVKLLEEVRDLALLGLTDEQIATAWNMSMGTFQKLKKDKRFREALQSGKMIANGKVAHALYQRALGYDYYVERAGFFQGQIVIAKVKQHLPGDPWSMVKWLQIRERAFWSEKQQIEITNTNININKIDFSQLSDEQLMLIQQIQLKQLPGHAEGG